MASLKLIYFEAKIEEYMQNINQSKSKAVEEKAEEEMLERDIDVLKVERGVPGQSKLNEEKMEVLNKFKSQKNAIADLNDDLKKKELERDNLQGVCEFAAILQKLESELQDIRDSFVVIEKRKVDFKNHLELLSGQDWVYIIRTKILAGCMILRT